MTRQPSLKEPARTMRAALVNGRGGIEVGRVAPPEPVRGQDLIQVTRAGVNFLDAGLASSISDRPTTTIPGIEVAGVRVSDGARVVSLCGQGGYAEQAVAASAATFEIPNGVSDEVALAVFVSGLTAWHLLHTVGRVSEGETVVIHSAAGSVGSLAVQLATHAGARVIATASTAAKREHVLALGASAAVDSAPDGMADRLLEAAGERGIDLILERDGGAVFDESMRALATLGRIVVYGTTSGARSVPTGSLIPRSQSISGFLLSTVMTPNHDPSSRLAELCALATSGVLDVGKVDARPLSSAQQALSDLVGRRTIGKVLLELNSEGGE